MHNMMTLSRKGVWDSEYFILTSKMQGLLLGKDRMDTGWELVTFYTSSVKNAIHAPLMDEDIKLCSRVWRSISE